MATVWGLVLGFGVVFVLGMVLLPVYTQQNVRLERPDGPWLTELEQPISREVQNDRIRPETTQSIVFREQRRLLVAKRRLLQRFASTPELGAALGLTAEQRQKIRHLVQTKLPPHPSKSASDSIDETVVNQVYTGGRGHAHARATETALCAEAAVENDRHPSERVLGGTWPRLLPTRNRSYIRKIDNFSI